MAENEKTPVDFHPAMFRIAAIAFVTAATVDVGSSFIGGPRFDFIGIGVIAILSYVGAVVSWFFPWHRVPVERFLVVIVMPGLALLGFMLMYTGGVHSHILPIFVAPAVFIAAAYGFRAGAAIALFTAATASLPLFTNGWDTYYARTLLVLAVATMLCAYIPSRVRRALLNEYETRRRQQEESYVATIGALAATLDAKDRYTEAHSRETAELAVNVGRRLGLQGEGLRLLEYGALLHDIGKIGIPGYILQKPGPLTPEEFAIMREHPVIGERILASVPFLAPLGPIVRAEHERWNGTGYPDGLKGEEIPIEALVPQDQCRVLLMNEDRTRLDVVYLRATDSEEYRAVTPENAAVEVGEGIAGWVAESRRGVVLGDTEHHPKAAHVPGTDVIDESMLAVPVVFADEILAVIVVLKLGLNQYSLDQLRLLTLLANQAAVAMANARLIDRLASAATVDALTGLMNRAAFEEALNKQMLRPQSWGTVLMLDVAKLREVNDAYGHRAGDAVLKRIARAIRASIRSDDLPSRWIGDDFAILSPGLDAGQAERLANRIEAALQSDRISIRWGVAEYHGDALTAQDLLAASLKSMAGKRDDLAAA